MLITVDGIVIGRRSVGDANCFLDILTAEYGVVEVMAHSVKKINSKNAASTALFSYAKFCLNKNGLRYTINSSEPKYSFHGISYDIVALSLATYFCEIIKHSTATEQVDKGIMRLFLITLYELEQQAIPLSQIKSVFELRMGCLLGFMPDFRVCAECFCYTSNVMYFSLNKGVLFCQDCFDDARHSNESVFALDENMLYIMRYVIYSEVKRIYKFRTSDKYVHELSVITESYLLSHLDRNFKSLDYYREIKVNL